MSEVIAMKEQRYLRHDLTERIVHWLMAGSVIVLIVTGLQVRFPGCMQWWSMNTARFLHFVFMYLFIFSWLFHLYHTLAVEFHEEITGWRDIRKIPQVLKYYLFMSDEHPLFVKYNALQKAGYNMLEVLILIQVVTGICLYWPTRLMGLTDLLGGLMAVRIVHDFMNYVFISFIIVHVYLVVLEDIRNLWAMFHGYYYRRVQ